MDQKKALGLFVAVAVLAYGAGKLTRTDVEYSAPKAGPAGPGYSEPQPGLGPADAPVVVVEILDYKCPACSGFQGVVKRLMVEHARDVRFVFKFASIFRGRSPETAQQSQLAAVAALAAQRQGAFAAYHDLLLQRQRQTWTRAALVGYAEELELDTKKFEEDLGDAILFDHVARDYAATGKVASLQPTPLATPSIFVNGKRVDLAGTDMRELAAAVRTQIVDARAGVQRIASGLEASNPKLRGGAAVRIARNQYAAGQHPAGRAFPKYLMENDVRDLEPEPIPAL